MSGKVALAADDDRGGNLRDRLYEAEIRRAWPIGSLAEYWRGRRERFAAMKRARRELRQFGGAR